jgi:chemotaxis response regulator CheB
MKSAANFWGRGAVGVLLTGMGEDGAEGLASIYHAGGTTLTQNQATSAIYGMPARAMELGVVHQSLAPEEIAEALIHLASGLAQEGA